jgi:hypothetical protein
MNSSTAARNGESGGVPFFRYSTNCRTASCSCGVRDRIASTSVSAAIADFPFAVYRSWAKSSRSYCAGILWTQTLVWSSRRLTPGLASRGQPADAVLRHGAAVQYGRIWQPGATPRDMLDCLRNECRRTVCDRGAGLGLQPGGSCQEILTESLPASNRITILPSHAPIILGLSPGEVRRERNQDRKASLIYAAVGSLLFVNAHNGTRRQHFLTPARRPPRPVRFSAELPSSASSTP